MIAFHGFQHLSDPSMVRMEGQGGWDGWIDHWVIPLREEKGVLDHHLHNPFGLYNIRDRAMHIDQFELACRNDASWLVDSQAFADAVADVHAAGGTVAAYVGSPLVVVCPDAPSDAWLPTCSPGSDLMASTIRLLRPFLCNVLGRCWCWQTLIRFYVKPLLDAHVDRIGFDWSADFCPGQCMDRLVRSLIAAGTEVMIEPWPRNDRSYPPVSWITREVRYWRCFKRKREDEVAVEDMTRPIYRVVPSSGTVEGDAEIAEIDALLGSDGPIGDTPDIVTRVLEDGHIPLVRRAQLLDGTVTVAAATAPTSRRHDGPKEGSGA